MNIVGLTLDEISELTAPLKIPNYINKEIALWIYQKGATSFDDMTNISKKVRLQLTEAHSIEKQVYSKVSESKDGTKKYLFPAGINQFIESAYIPDKDRHTLCVSSQVGCKMNCSFCMTGRQGFQNHLLPRDILNQIMQIDESEKLTNLVYMGMGEPFDNVKNVLKSLEILTSDYGFAMSPRRITVSTIGIIPGMIEFIEKSDCNLAISLHSPFDEEREQLIPMQGRYSIQQIVDTLKKYPFRRQRSLSFEYILFKDLNDSANHVNQLARVLNGLRCKINLIRFHSIPGSKLKSSSYDDLAKFKSMLERKGITTTIRKSRGEDIMAACGLLSTAEKKKNKPVF